ncbi:nitrilotriacetate monooxygenase component B [Candidatus Endolissoclinum faulkneri L5]|uniref:Nitrilotriacetate monooxygenase component B n=1 Tax=Candidatus Endolissoclinum faulkneri L5 TaxID=1401328 RepID=V9TRU7_9PROT|nr:flavin reductase family protein [Candidatus Endolissoclinum faulkneri]AHC73281.1 nitrilotriacetate monooxygenase component B [Candidatus Endolissoclinum faulkneri L5]
MIFYEPGQHKEHGFSQDPFKAFCSPRPIGWIGSIDNHRRTNLAPYSFFNAMASNPPQIIFGSGSRRDGSKKDSQRNIEDTGQFTLSIVGHALKEDMNATSIALPYGESEFESIGIEGAASHLVKPLWVAKAPIAFECVYRQTIDMESWDSTQKNYALIGTVIGIHVSEEVIVNGKADVTLWQPISRLGYYDYATITEVFEMLRP